MLLHEEIDFDAVAELGELNDETTDPYDMDDDDIHAAAVQNFLDDTTAERLFATIGHGITFHEVLNVARDEYGPNVVAKIIIMARRDLPTAA